MDESRDASRRDVFEELVHLRRLGRKCALATVVDASGSVPGWEAAKMLVREDGSILGTVGGGSVEAEVMRAAREVMVSEKPRYLSFTLSADAFCGGGPICGGQVKIFIEPVVPQPRVFIFGAGHISKSLSKMAATVGFAVVIVDDRESFANRERFPEADEIFADEYEKVFPRLIVDGSSFIVIVTRGHQDDMRVLRWAATTGARYVAMIGSKRKVVSLVEELVKEGLPRSAFDSLYAPMGLEIGAVTPEEIAISVVAEMIAVRRAADPAWRRISKSIFVNESLRTVLQ